MTILEYITVLAAFAAIVATIGLVGALLDNLQIWWQNRRHR